MIIFFIFLLSTFLISGQCNSFRFYRNGFKQSYDITSWTQSISGQAYHKDATCAQEFLLKTEEEINVPVIFFDRNSDKVVIAGQGFGGTKEDMILFAEIFSNYDVVCFDYRWTTDKYFFLRPSTISSPIQSILLDEQEELNVVINFLKERKKYKEIIGAGLCYSASLFLIAQVNQQASAERPFTKLIFDSTWLSLRDFIDNITLDPYLPFRPQTGGCPEALKKILRQPIFHRGMSSILEFIVTDYSLDNYLSRLLDIPLLFIHGSADLLVPLDIFREIWHLTRNNNYKCAFITPYEHSNSVQNKLIYQQVCSKFIELDFDNFVQFFVKESIN